MKREMLQLSMEVHEGGDVILTQEGYCQDDDSICITQDQIKILISWLTDASRPKAK